jgi:hypothetical protein
VSAFQNELRNQLPAPYLISHGMSSLVPLVHSVIHIELTKQAPVAPWFTSQKKWAKSAYVGIHREVGWGIDFYNVQFYNQGQWAYVDCGVSVWFPPRRSPV